MYSLYFINLPLYKMLQVKYLHLKATQIMGLWHSSIICIHGNLKRLQTFIITTCKIAIVQRNIGAINQSLSQTF